MLHFFFPFFQKEYNREDEVIKDTRHLCISSKLTHKKSHLSVYLSVLFTYMSTMHAGLCLCRIKGRIQFPKSVRTMKKMEKTIPLSFTPPWDSMPSYMTMFQSSPVKIWRERGRKGFYLTKTKKYFFIKKKRGTKTLLVYIKTLLC